MGTFKRTPFEIDTTIGNGSKFLNQTQFTGIVQNNNSFDVDQNSFTDALNVYVNDQNTLVSREPLVIDNLEINYPSETAELIDIKEANNVKVFVFKDTETYTIIAYRDGTSISLTGISNYHLSIFNQYIICWNNLGAKVINTNNAELKWKPISEFAEIPITKIVTGPSVTTLDYNRLTTKRKEQYIIEESLRTILPENKKPNSVELLDNKTTYTLNDYYRNTDLIDYRLYSVCNYSSTYDDPLEADEISVSGSVVCINVKNGFQLSLNYGQTFSLISYPNIASTLLKARLSNDGRAVFVIAKDAVYRYTIGDNAWTIINVHNDVDTKIIGNEVLRYNFVNSEVFMFVTNANGSGEDGYKRLYFKAPTLVDSSENSNTLCVSILNDISTFGFWNSNNVGDWQRRQSFAVDFYIDGKIGGAFTLTIQPNASVEEKYVYIVFFMSGDDNIIQTKTIKYGPYSDIIWPSASVSDIILEQSETTRTIKVEGIDNRAFDTTGVYRYWQSIKFTKSTKVWSNNTYTKSTQIETSAQLSYFLKIANNVYLDASVRGNNYMCRLSDGNTYNVPGYTDEAGITYTIGDAVSSINRDTIYYASYYRSGSTSEWRYGLVCTNLASTTATFTYEVNDSSLDTIINKVPSITYSGSELFLGFGNELMITKNIKDGSDILFNLPKVYSQAFTNDIKAIVNISTTELAIFFENGITICSKVSDEVLGYNYNLTKTRLTLGTKFGDSVINTADGASTLYATPRGLAIMNYQAYMATTDQTLQFISDKIYDIWNKFYLSSENITLVQHGDYVFIYNTTNKYLMLDLRNASWWKFEIPYNIKKMLTDQVDLRVIADKLYKFKKIDNGTDKIEDDYIDNRYRDPGDETINWRFMSQRLHFGLPNHYKNMKQIIFHMVQSTGHLSTFATQIKLYRNSVNYKDMEVIPFDFNFYVDEFRTFVKRFNYWKINMLQYGIANDNKTAIPARLVLNGIGVKYEIGDEVR